MITIISGYFQAKVWKQFLDDYPMMFRYLEKELEKNKGGTGFFVGDGVSTHFLSIVRRP